MDQSHLNSATGSEGPLVSILIPAYNERDTIEELIGRVAGLPFRKEMIVVDDGSSDGTAEVLQRLVAEGMPDLKLVVHPRGTAARAPPCAPASRPRAATIVVIQDADLEYDPHRRARADRPDRRGPRGRGLRHPAARRPAPASAPVLALRRQPLALPAHQRALQHHDLRHGGGLQGLPGGPDPLDRPGVGGLRHRAGGDREDPAPQERPPLRDAGRPTTGAPTRRARRSPGATGSWP